MKFNTIENKIFDFLIGENTKSFIEKTILYISILGYFSSFTINLFVSIKYFGEIDD